MIQVRFFARVREQLDCELLELPWEPRYGTLDGLQVALEQRGEHWREVLRQPNLIRAVNQAVVSTNAILQAGDEVAFYPPVTGG